MAIHPEDIVWRLERGELTLELAEAAAERIKDLEREVLWLESEVEAA